MFSIKNVKDSFSLAAIYWVFSMLVAVALIVSGVNGAGKRSSGGTTSNTNLSTTFPMTVTDDLGRTVTIGKIPQRIVSLAPSNTEILFDLGLGDKVVGDTMYDDYPAAAQDKPHVGGYSDIDVEKVVSLAPDLILAEDIHKAEVIPALERLGFTVYAVVPHNLDEIMASVTTIGRLTGANKEAKSIVADMQKRIKAVSDKTAELTDAQRPSVLYVLWQDPLMSVGTDTPIYEMINLAGGKSIVQSGTGYPTLSLEEVIDSNPQVVVCNVDYSFAGGDAPLQFMLTEPRLKGVAAVTAGRVYGINASLTNRPVPRIIDGLEWMAAMIHPELFPQFVTEYMGTSAAAK